MGNGWSIGTWYGIDEWDWTRLDLELSMIVNSVLMKKKGPIEVEKKNCKNREFKMPHAR